MSLTNTSSNVAREPDQQPTQKPFTSLNQLDQSPHIQMPLIPGRFSTEFYLIVFTIALITLPPYIMIWFGKIVPGDLPAFVSIFSPVVVVAGWYAQKRSGLKQKEMTK